MRWSQVAELGLPRPDGDPQGVIQGHQNGFVPNWAKAERREDAFPRFLVGKDNCELGGGAREHGEKHGASKVASARRGAGKCELASHLPQRPS
eukprot:9238664-Lingulodinium_polyedra.AAC.1